MSSTTTRPRRVPAARRPPCAASTTPSYYRQMADGDYIDVTGCGNTIDFSLPAAAARWCSIRCATGTTTCRSTASASTSRPRSGATPNVDFDPQHPLLEAIAHDPTLAGAKMIAEPWDVGAGGWQVGQVPRRLVGMERRLPRPRPRLLADRHRRRPAQRRSRRRASAVSPRRLAGSSHVFSRARGPMASVNFITAHDGFTMADLTAYNQKHNLGNGENNRDGTDNNHSFNHGVEGPTRDEAILASRWKAMRNLLGTLLLSAGIPMIDRGRRVRAKPARQQQRVLPGQRPDLARLGRARRSGRTTCSPSLRRCCGSGARTRRFGPCATGGSARPCRRHRRWTGTTPRDCR